jgi:photosystem II stability/assembly factor-like uncharacterized protein
VFTLLRHLSKSAVLPAAIVVVFLLGGVSPATAQYKLWHLVVQGQGECVGINPINPNTIYAQGIDSRLDVSYDQGMTWTPISSGIPYETREIIVHPRDTTVMFAVAFYGGLWRSTDAGVSWNSVIANYGIDGESVSYDPVHPDTMWAGNFNDGSIYRSLDRGATWTYRGKSGTNMCTMQVRPDSNMVLLAGTGGGTISKSTDGGVTWVKKKFGGSVETPRIVVNPNNPSIIYATAFSNPDPSTLGVWKSTDGGEHWNLTNLNNISVWSLEIDNLHPDTLYAGTFGDSGAGIYRTSDGGNSWTLQTNGFFGYNSIWNMKIDPVNPANVYAAVTIGDFGNYGVFKLINADAGITGTVRDSASGTPITNGSIQLEPSGDYFDLSYSAGKYSFYRPAYDTSSVYTLNVYVNTILSAVQTAHFVFASVQQEDVLDPMGTISGVVFNDLNGNGVRDAGEPGIGGVQLTLTGQAVISALTDSTGAYAVHVGDGFYTVTSADPYGFVQTSSASSFSASIAYGTKTQAGNNFGFKRTGRFVSASVPRAYSTGNGLQAPIKIIFDSVMNAATFNDTLACIVAGARSGRHRGTFAFSADTVTFSPGTPFSPGEVVTVDLTSHLKDANGIPLIPYTLQMNTKTAAHDAIFAAPVSYTIGSNPDGVAVADLNGDGYPDLVVANSGSNSVSVLLNDGHGGFLPENDYNVGSAQSCVTLADVNNDGLTDIIVGNTGTSTISVLLNVGGGTFGAAVKDTIKVSPSAISAADMNGDGYEDLAGVSGGYFDIVSNDSTFGLKHTVSTQIGGFLQSFLIADLNTDGSLDFATISQVSPSIVTLGYNLEGGIGLHGTLDAGLSSEGIAAIDLDGDGRPELVVSNSGSNTVSIFWNAASNPFAERTDLASGANPYGVASADFDGDGLNDIVVTNQNGGTVSYFRNNGNGTFTRIDFATGGQGPTAVIAADLNNDGRPDIITLNQTTGNISVLLNTGAPLVSSLAQGWNLVSVPAVTIGLTTQNIFPSAVSRLFSYNGNQYIANDTPKVGSGYWVKVDSTSQVDFTSTGQLVTAETVNVGIGWQLFGSSSIPVPVDSIVTIPSGIIASHFIGLPVPYGGSGFPFTSGVDTLFPGRGYWVKISKFGKLILPGPPGASAPKLEGKLRAPFKRPLH